MGSEVEGSMESPSGPDRVYSGRANQSPQRREGDVRHLARVQPAVAPQLQYAFGLRIREAGYVLGALSFIRDPSHFVVANHDSVAGKERSVTARMPKWR